MKKLLNDPNQLVSDFLDGFTAVHTSQLKRLPNSNVVIRKQPKTDKVGVISGGAVVMSLLMQVMLVTGCSMLPYAVKSLLRQGLINF